MRALLVGMLLLCCQAPQAWRLPGTPPWYPTGYPDAPPCQPTVEEWEVKLYSGEFRHSEFISDVKPKRMTFYRPTGERSDSRELGYFKPETVVVFHTADLDRTYAIPDQAPYRIFVNPKGQKHK